MTWPISRPPPFAEWRNADLRLMPFTVGYKKEYSRYHLYSTARSSTHVGDPGVSLVQLFVWPSEQLLYGTNGVPEAARRAALRAAAYRAFHEHHAFVFARGVRTHRESFRSWCASVAPGIAGIVALWDEQVGTRVLTGKPRWTGWIVTPCR